MTLNSYYIRARLLPTALTVIPLLIFTNVIMMNYCHEALKEILSILPFLTSIGFSTALLFLMVQINRFIAKEVFQRIYFKEETQMPTTNHIMWSSIHYDNSTKTNIRSKIKSKFDITLMSPDEERADEANARKQICIAVSQIRNSLRDNKLLLQHNIEYGFFRNLLGGCLIALIFSICILIYGFTTAEMGLKITGIALSIIYLIPILFSSLIINRFGSYYSKILYEQFLSI
jgi:hypothetical protein